MLAFRPLQCNFDMPPRIDPLVSTLQGRYHLAPIEETRRALIAPGLEAENRISYQQFILRQPGCGLTVYVRQFLMIKLHLLLGEWERRHSFFIEYCQSDNVQCGEGCPLVGKTGTHCKNEVEVAWEQAAADAFNHFSTQLNCLAILEHHCRIITRYAAEDTTEFGPDSVPISLFALPNVRGPDLPPGDRVDASVGFDKKVSRLTPGADDIKLLIACIYQTFYAENKALAERYGGTHAPRSIAPEGELQRWGAKVAGWFTTDDSTASRVANAPGEQGQSATKTD